MAGICFGLVSDAEAATVLTEPLSRSKGRACLDFHRRLTVVSSPKIPTVEDDEEVSVPPKKRTKFADCSDRSACDAIECIPSVARADHARSVELEKSSSTGSCIHDDRNRFGMTSVCGRRKDMEDAVSIHTGFADGGSLSFFGIFDGHGCSHVAMRCRDRLHEIVQEEIDVSPAPREWRDLMERSFVAMDKDVEEWTGTAGTCIRRGIEVSSCRCELQTTQCDAVGSTAVVAVLNRETIVVSNCGDSRAVLCRNGVAVPLSTDHKPDRPDELLRIEKAGGRVIFWDGARVLGVLAMSRAIGDNYLKPYVIPLPEVTVTERSEGDECLILASDGLWDVVTNEMACGVARMCLKAQSPPSQTAARSVDSISAVSSSDSDKACSDAAVLLTKLALARHSSDNVSVVVIDLRTP